MATADQLNTTDGTTVTQKPTQSVGVIAVTYIYQLP